VAERYSSVSIRRYTWIVLLTLLVSLGTAPFGSAARSPEAREMAGETAHEAQKTQYHGVGSGQYQGQAAALLRISAWNRGIRRNALELTTPIAANVISPFKSFHSGISSANEQYSARFDPETPSRNDRSIRNRIGSRDCLRESCSSKLEAPPGARRYHESAPSDRNPRLMLQLGGVFGLLYLAFLAIWVWATRFRIQPPRGART
jgi:hypothetical protein